MRSGLFFFFWFVDVVIRNALIVAHLKSITQIFILSPTPTDKLQAVK